MGKTLGNIARDKIIHNYRGSITASYEGHLDQYYYGRRPTQVMMPNFRNVHKQETDFLRGYMVFFGASRGKASAEGVGAAFKEALTEPGPWSVFMMMQGETIPKESNHVRLHPTLKDAWGIPQIITSIDYDDNNATRALAPGGSFICP